MIIVDVILAGLAYFLAYYLRFDGDIPAGAFANWMKTVVWIVPIKLASLIFFGSYKGMWRYTGLYDIEHLVKACVFSTAVIVSVLVITVRFEGFPRSVFAIDLLLTFLFLSGVRVGIRLFLTPGHVLFKVPFFGNVDRDGIRILKADPQITQITRINGLAQRRQAAKNSLDRINWMVGIFFDDEVAS